MNVHLDAALAYARRGWRVFPLHGIVNGRCTCGRRDCSSPGKHPLVRHGVKEATSEARVIKEWWSRCRSANIGVATGRVSHIVVVDVDLPRALPSLEALVHKLPRTLTALTGGGGLHLLLVHPADRGLHNCASRLPGIARELPGIDLRAVGGYIVTPPSVHVSGARYEWLDENAPIAPAPAWLREPQRRVTHPIERRTCVGDGSAYGLAALRDELDRLRAAPVGTRNHTLNRAAFCLGQLVARGELAEDVVRSALLETATTVGLTARESQRTVTSGLSAGSRDGRERPH